MVIYTKDTCPACEATKKFLDNNNIKYIENNIDEKDSYREELLEHGYSSVPVIFLENGETILGFDLQKLQKLTK